MRFRLSLVASIAVAGLAVTSVGLGGGGGGPDRDGDGVPSKVDNCELPDRPQVSFNPSQLDVYPQGGDGVGDACQSGVLVLHNRSSYELLEYELAPESFRNLGDATGRSCAAHTTCTFDDGTSRARTHWHAAGTDDTGSNLQSGLCPPDPDAVLDEPGDCDPAGAFWTVDFAYTLAGYGDDATGPECKPTIFDEVSACDNPYTQYNWQPELRGPDTTPPNAGPELLQTAEGVETMTARDILPSDQTPAEGDPPSEYVLSPATPVPMSPAGPLEPGTYPTELWWSGDSYFEHGVVGVTATTDDTAALTGVVVDARAGSDPIPGAAVSMSRRDCDGCAPLTVTTTTDVDGTFAFAGLPAGIYALVVHADGYEDLTVADDPYDAWQAYVTRIELENATG